jgi:phosphoglycerate dehydrogenase-like enzyme
VPVSQPSPARSPAGAPRVHVGPRPNPALAEAVRRGGGSVAAPEDAEALVWTGGGSDELAAALRPGIRWVQLPAAGVERWLPAVDSSRSWTSAAGAYAPQVAEHAVALLLACAHRLHEHARTTTWTHRTYVPLDGATVTVLGAGGIGRRVVSLLGALGSEVVAVTRDGRPVEGAARSATLDSDWTRTDHVVAVLPSTPATRGVLGAATLGRLRPHSCVVNVGRGDAIDLTALLSLLDAGRLGAAGLDVTDPEPLPDDHPAWTHPGVLVTSHSANPAEVLARALAARVEDNVRRFAAGDPLLGPIDPARGY